MKIGKPSGLIAVASRKGNVKLWQRFSCLLFAVHENAAHYFSMQKENSAEYLHTHVHGNLTSAAKSMRLVQLLRHVTGAPRKANSEAGLR
jgi:hypothetical protein